MKNRKEEESHETSQEVGALHEDYSLPYYMPNYDDENYNEAYRGGYRLFGGFSARSLQQALHTQE